MEPVAGPKASGTMDPRNLLYATRQYVDSYLTDVLTWQSLHVSLHWTKAHEASQGANWAEADEHRSVRRASDCDGALGLQLALESPVHDECPFQLGSDQLHIDLVVHRDDQRGQMLKWTDERHNERFD
jgi:hypothetical protein